MKDSSSIAVLMTCYNRVETTLRCLHSLFYRNRGVGMAVVCFCHMLARAVLNWEE